MENGDLNPLNWVTLEKTLGEEAEVLAAARELRSAGVSVLRDEEIMPGDGIHAGVDKLRTKVRDQSAISDAIHLSYEFGFAEADSTLGGMTRMYPRLKKLIDYRNAWKNSIDYLDARVDGHILLDQYIKFKQNLQSVADREHGLDANSALEAFMCAIAKTNAIQLGGEGYMNTVLLTNHVHKMAQELGNTRTSSDLRIRAISDRRKDLQSKYAVEKVVYDALKELALSIFLDPTIDSGAKRQSMFGVETNEDRRKLCKSIRDYIANKLHDYPPEATEDVSEAPTIKDSLVFGGSDSVAGFIWIKDTSDKFGSSFLDFVDKRINEHKGNQ